jgi:hypothetical protein
MEYLSASNPPCATVLNMDFEEAESVIITLEPSSTCRLSAALRATVNIADDEPFPTGALDAFIMKGVSGPVGREVIDSFVFPPQFPATQSLNANGALNVSSTFVISATALRGQSRSPARWMRPGSLFDTSEARRM